MTGRIRAAIAAAGIVLACGLGGCASAPEMPPPEELVAPEPIPGSGGTYKCPYTSDGTVAEWVSMALESEAFGQIGGSLGGFATGYALRNVPILGMFGSLIGGEVSESISRNAAISAAGGEERIAETSDLSFADPADMAVYLYVEHSTHPDYGKVIGAAAVIYPELGEVYQAALRDAPRRAAAVAAR